MRNYPRQQIEDFGRQLIETGDLDPVYVALAGHDKVPWGDAQVKRFLLAYACLYHCGVACYLSEFQGQLFFAELMKAARNETPAPTGDRWPRGSERRHWRGQQAVASCEALYRRYGGVPEAMFSTLAWRNPGDNAAIPFRVVSERTKEHRGFGDWIGFKCADLVDRVLGVPVCFTEAAVFMFTDPEKAAMMLWEEREGHKYEGKVRPKREVILHGVTDYLINHFADLDAPPLGDRPINIQEVETVLCKWKSHMNGHYPPGNDIREIHHGLDEWLPHSSAARQFKEAMPPVP